jgi:hypothetical protein
VLGCVISEISENVQIWVFLQIYSGNIREKTKTILAEDLRIIEKLREDKDNDTINKKCVAYPQEDFLFIKLIISLLNKCKKDFQFHTESNFFYTKYKIFFT